MKQERRKQAMKQDIERVMTEQQDDESSKESTAKTHDETKIIND